jgi:Tol biopolymer transport system component
MSAPKTRSRFAACAGLAICLAIALGCDAVQEDRHVEFSPSGDQVAFQHGRDGIFIADPQTGELRKVFDPDQSIVTVSTPLWSDDERRAVFTTAREENQPPRSQAAGTPTSAAQSRESSSSPAAWEDAPDGRSFFPQSIAYTCWLVVRAPDGSLAKPTPLFEARLNHSGYVAANLVVRWHPRQKTILFVDREPNGGHAVWSYDFETKRKQRFFPSPGQSAPAHVIADFVPDGNHVICVAGAATGIDVQPRYLKAEPQPSSGGIWIGSTDGSSWWHVAESTDERPEAGFQGLSHLMARRPVCAPEGGTFAFVRIEAGQKDSKPRSIVFRGRIADRKVERAYESTGDLLNLHWSPDGSQLGFVATDPMPTLKVVDLHGRTSQPFPDCVVRTFAGWNAAGDKIACVVAEKTPPRVPESWALLLLPDPLARDSILLADAHGSRRTVASGLRFTFPHWSPKRDQLSVWGTFSPSHRSLASDMWLGGLGLRRGDPAAVVDTSTGAIRWLAINGDELAQIGHFFLLKHDDAQAREWYRKADKQLPKLEPLRPADLLHGLSGAAARRRTFEIFYWYCLTKLNEPNEAATRLAAFDSAHRIEWPPIADRSAAASRPAEKRSAPATSDPALASSSGPARREMETLVSISKALSIAQIFLSVGDADGAQAYFNRRLESADDPDRLGDLMALSQLCLLRKDDRDYVALVTDRLAPLLAETLQDPPDAKHTVDNDPAVAGFTVPLLAAHVAGPLFCDGFLKELPTEFVSQLVPKWEALRGRCHSQFSTLCVDLFLRAAAVRLGHEKERVAADARIQGNPVHTQLIPPQGLEPYFATLRASSAVPGGK